jgi:asparagine synthase (glutamine-hydrolysing)
MCGILGWIGSGDRVPELHWDLLRHRGPDDNGVETFRSRTGAASAVFAATRLAVIDLSHAGHMPMVLPDAPLAIVYNGEIYNFRALRSELTGLGERFFSATDTEVILRGYRVWGDAVVRKLRGMFAFAIWDGREEGRVLIARDRFGKKPLYYRLAENNALWFSSELKAILSPDAKREIDPEGLAYYMDRGYPPSDACLIRGFRKVKPGHTLVWSNGRISEERYWTPPDLDEGMRDRPEKEIIHEFRERLEEAVRIRLVADVPVGALLSGGIDSGTITHFMSQSSKEHLRTYTACFGATMVDESENARQMALHLGSVHRSIMINPRSGRLLPFIASHMDEPIADPSAIATYLICRRARREVTVLLTGDGSDELLLGYPRYQLHALAQMIAGRPRILRKTIGRLFPLWSIPEKALSAPGDPLTRDRYWLDHEKNRTNAFGKASRRYSPAEAIRTVLNDDIASWLPEEVLTKLDKMAMATSVETRSPFLDGELADWVIGLPVWRRMSFTQGKTILRKAMKGVLPLNVSRRPKQAFLLPIDEWLRSEWRTLLEDVLYDERTRQRGWFDPAATDLLVREHLAGRASHGRRLYQLLVLELWARSILDRGEAESIPSDIEDCSREIPFDKPIRKIAVIAPAGIGDTMRLTPALRRLKERDPYVSVALYVNDARQSDEAMSGLPPVDRQVQIAFSRRGIGKLYRLTRDIRKNRTDVLVSTWISHLAGPAGFLSGVHLRSGLLPEWSRIIKFTGRLWVDQIPYNPPQSNVGFYDMKQFARLLGIDGIEDGCMSFSEPIWPEKRLREAMASIRELPRPILAVSAGAAAYILQREYPLAKMARVVETLLAESVVNSVILLGDRNARTRLRDLSAAVGGRGLDLCGELTVSSSAKVMSLCDAALVVDGGLLHIALSTDIPVVALYGPTEIFTDDPRGGGNGRYKCLSAFDRCNCLCLNHRGIKIREECRHESRCLDGIDPRQIVGAVEELLRQSAASPGDGKSAALAMTAAGRLSS